MFWFLLRNRWHRLGRLWHTQSAGQIVTAVAFLGVFLLLATGFGAALIYGFRAVEENEFLRTALPFFLYELFLLVITGLVFVSATISGVFRLFRGRGDFWIMASPQYRALLSDVAVGVSVLSLWPLVVLAVPMLTAMAVVYNIGLAGLAVGLLTVTSLGVVATLSSLCMLLGLAHVVTKIQRWRSAPARFTWYIGNVAATLLLGALAVWYALRDFSLGAVFAVEDYTITEAPVNLIAAQFQYFPSHVVAQALLTLQQGTVELAITVLATLLILVLLLIGLYRFLGTGFLRLWQELQEGSFAARTTRSETGMQRQVTHFPDRPIPALLRKEWLLFLRTPRDLLWLGFLCALWLIVTSFDLFLKENTGNTSSLATPQLIQALQMLVIVYFSAAITLRFVFPTFSIERDTAWILLHAPLARSRWFFAKATFFIGVFVCLSLVIASIHLILLPTTVTSAALFLLYTVVTSITTTLLGLGLGARFPNFTTNDPQQLATSVPGLAFILGAITYGVASAYSLHLVFTAGSIWSLGGFLLVSAGISWLLWRLGAQAISRLDFSGTVAS